MKKTNLLLTLVLLASACSSTKGYLLSKVEYNGDGSIFERTNYHYSNGVLDSMTRVINYNNNPNSILTSYEIKQNGQITDTVVIRNGNKKDIKSSDGTIRSYKLVGDEWKEVSLEKKDEKGRLLERISNDIHNWYTYDSQGRSTGNTYIRTGENNQLQRGGRRIEYSDDGSKSVIIEYLQIDSLPTIISSKSIIEYDKKGRIINRESYDPDESDNIYPSFVTDSYQYTPRGVIRIESSKEYRDGSYHNEAIMKYKEKYKHGLRTKLIVYKRKDDRFIAQTINKYKYNFRSGVPKKAITYDAREPIILRRPSNVTIWTYEK